MSNSERSARPLTLEERRVRRLEKREKQRLANAERALKMREARIAGDLFSQPVSTEPPAVNIGCSGWFYWHWKGSFYPPDLSTRDWFNYYAKHFPTVELNAPFYSWPTVATVNEWLRQAGKREFVYTVKVCELITHVKRFVHTKTLVQDFGFIGNLLGQRMGCFLYQLPPSYHYTPARLRTILEQLDPTRRNVVEFRHRTWWNPEVYAAFRKTGTIFCSCSGPRLPDQLIRTADDVYIRFHGPTNWYRHDYTPAQLSIWARRIKGSGCKRVWAYFNNDREAFAIKNAKELRRQLQ